ncbi:hypothetical protein IRZ71_05630 [Flavobacterium sp. ANB]|uniref:hypothetical protein n=1 Tax=unclassified Flavobacterium TaxID=196869 RepID=UPI0012BA2A56|nr:MULTISPECIES: hypothetical protein [unclassified Flavobacterium]MBF4515811.1 hypothetical protein [Flavobacterium sp. ANB]MTD68814.1 hypothetical protein [Flavobacterium sp. LC2016-13]
MQNLNFYNCQVTVVIISEAENDNSQSETNKLLSSILWDLIPVISIGLEFIDVFIK